MLALATAHVAWTVRRARVPCRVDADDVRARRSSQADRLGVERRVGCWTLASPSRRHRLLRHVVPGTWLRQIAKVGGVVHRRQHQGHRELLLKGERLLSLERMQLQLILPSVLLEQACRPFVCLGHTLDGGRRERDPDGSCGALRDGAPVELPAPAEVVRKFLRLLLHVG
eukprot:3504904-Rhodomonas_salina.1